MASSVLRGSHNFGVVANVTIDYANFPVLTSQTSGILQNSSVESLVLTGDMFSINKVLKTLKYQPYLNIYGYDHVEMEVWDNGHYGYRFENLSTTPNNKILTIEILPVNDTPTISF